MRDSKYRAKTNLYILILLSTCHIISVHVQGGDHGARVGAHLGDHQVTLSRATIVMILINIFFSHHCCTEAK